MKSRTCANVFQPCPEGVNDGKRKDMEGVGARRILSLFPSPILHHLTDGGRKVVTLLAPPDKTPARRLRRQPRSSFAIDDYQHWLLTEELWVVCGLYTEIWSYAIGSGAW